MPLQSQHRPYQICMRCVMDTTDPNIIFDEEGVCNHCKTFDKQYAAIPANQPNWEEQLNALVIKIKQDGKNKEYDCIIGLSGGVDSSYVAYQVKRLGLRPLAIHLDNGWNSELAVQNIENIVKILNIDLYTHVIDWEEFKDLQLSFLKASVIDIEILTDHAIAAILYRMARKYNIKYFVSGGNFATEGIMPHSWVFSKNDSWNIKGIHNLFGQKPIKTFPLISPFSLLYYRLSGSITRVNILNYMPYGREEAIELLEEKVKWRNYGGKHHESFFTKFYQNYILPQKFNVDKRKAHYSTLICSKQLSRAETEKLLKQDIYPVDELNEDLQYFIKKFNLSQREFNDIMKAPIKEHSDYPTVQAWLTKVKALSPSSLQTKLKQIAS